MLRRFGTMKRHTTWKLYRNLGNCRHKKKEESSVSRNSEFIVENDGTGNYAVIIDSDLNLCLAMVV